MSEGFISPEIFIHFFINSNSKPYTKTIPKLKPNPNLN